MGFALTVLITTITVLIAVTITSVTMSVTAAVVTKSFAKCHQEMAERCWTI